jgi:hypothetical protein
VCLLYVQDEINHVALLRSALGSAAVPQPQIDIGAAFSAAANAAVGATLSPSFTAYGSDLLFYHAAFIFGELLCFIHKHLQPTIRLLLSLRHVPSH